jgi:trimeric autotransporter adhesin
MIYQVTGSAAVRLVQVGIPGASGSSSGFVPTGTGVPHIVGGIMLAAASLVSLTADVTGVLPVANQAAQTMAGDVTGTTAVSVVARVNGATVPIAGALTTGNAAYVSGASALTYSALNLAGGSGWVTGLLPVANIAPSGTNTQVLTTTGGVAVWAAPAAAGITQLTGDATAGPGSGSQAITVVAAQAGAITFASGTGLIGFATGDTGPGLSQATAGSGVTPVNLTLMPQAPNAGSATTASGTPGSLLVALSAPVSTGNEAYAQILRGGTPVVSLGGYFGGGSSLGAIYFAGNTPAAAPNNYGFLGGAAYTILNAPAGGTLYGAIGNGLLTTLTSGAGGAFALTAGLNLSVNAVAGSYGGGIGVLALANATTQPSTAPSGGVIAYSTATHAFGLYNDLGNVTTIGNGIVLDATQTFPGLSQSSTVTTGTAIPMSITAQRATGTGSVGGALQLSGGQGVLTGGAGLLTGGSAGTTGGNAGCTGGTGVTGGAGFVFGGAGTVTGGQAGVTAGTGTTTGGIASVTGGSGVTGGATQIASGNGSTTNGALSLNSKVGAGTAGAWSFTGPALTTTTIAAIGAATISLFAVTVDGVSHQFLLL